MANNQADPRAEFLQCTMPSTVVSNDPLLLGTMAIVAQESYSSARQSSFARIGAFFLTCTAKSSLSPSVNSAIKPGDKIYADSDGTTDAATNVTRGFTLDKASGGTFFGYALDDLATGTSGVIRVALKVGG